jgi:hypothetical protein
MSAAGGRKSPFSMFFSVMPYAGGGREYEKVDVNIDVIPFYIPDRTVSSDRPEDFMFAGINFSVSIMRKINISAKYRADFLDEERRDTWDAGATFMFTPHAGLTYKYKLMEFSSQKISYHLGGIVLRI